MLLYRFEIDVTPNVQAVVGEKIRVTVSMYRQSVDPVYQRVVSSKIEAGNMDQYILMILRNVLSRGKLSEIHGLMLNYFL